MFEAQNIVEKSFLQQYIIMSNFGLGFALPQKVLSVLGWHASALLCDIVGKSKNARPRYLWRVNVV